MPESYGEGVASHTGPKPCAGAREGMGEASAGVRAGHQRKARCCDSSGCRYTDIS